jgi:glycyl-tRNA synthetase beta chain
VHAFAQLPEAQALAAANKRVSNILGKLESTHSFGEVSASLLHAPQEKALSDAIQSLTASFEEHLARDEFTQALSCLAALRAPVDAFFEDVMVNAEDEALRQNRLNLLKQLRDLFLGVADISLLVVTK